MTKPKTHNAFFIKRTPWLRLYPLLLILAWVIFPAWDFKHPFKAQPTKPIQYVCVAFDGSGYDPEFWETSLTFSKRHNAHFTYFLSGVFLLSPWSKVPERHSSTYVGPAGSYSKIGWAKSDAEIEELLVYLRRAYREGHEIGSHAMGHLHGKKWSEAQWDKEFNAFQKTWLTVLQMPTSNLVGFRSPYLDKNPAMYRSLKKFNYVYDTSETAPMDYQPTRNAQGIWIFPLAEIPIHGLRARTISMDYNLFYFDVRRPKHLGETLELKKERVLQTYRDYFYHNYNGSKAPVHIGHHFEHWNKNIYQDALWEFLEEVSKLPDVKIITYQELAEKLSSK